VKFPVVAPAATATLAGTVAFALLLDNATDIPPPGAGPLNVTVQLDDPGAFTVDGLQETPVSVTGVAWMTVITPLVPDEGIEFPSESDATTPFTVTGTFVLALPAEIVKVAVATEPFGITLVDKSNRTHVMDPPILEHDALLGPPTAVTLMTSTG
jgi:hypothetical protein